MKQGDGSQTKLRCTAIQQQGLTSLMMLLSRHNFVSELKPERLSTFRMFLKLSLRVVASPMISASTVAPDLTPASPASSSLRNAPAIISVEVERAK